MATAKYVPPHMRGRETAGTTCVLDPEDSRTIVGIQIIRPDGRFLLVQGSQYLTEAMGEKHPLTDYVRHMQRLPVAQAPTKESATQMFLQQGLTDIKSKLGRNGYIYLANILCKGKGDYWSARFAVPRDTWGFVKGAAHADGEMAHVAARRELYEELGYTPSSQKYDAFADMGGGLFRLQLSEAEVRELEANWAWKQANGFHEIADIRWVHPSEAQRWKLNADTRRWLTQMQRQPTSSLTSTRSSQSMDSLGGGRRGRTKKVKRHVVPAHDRTMLRRTKKA